MTPQPPDHSRSNFVAGHDAMDASNRELRAGGLTLDVVRRTAQLSGKPLHLTPSEFALLQVLIEHPGYVCTRSQLRQRLPGGPGESLDRTMDVYLRNIRRKLDPAGLALSYVETVFGTGYRVTERTTEGKRLP